MALFHSNTQRHIMIICFCEYKVGVHNKLKFCLVRSVIMVCTGLVISETKQKISTYLDMVANSSS